jgi:enoyl-CoA hydratase
MNYEFISISNEGDGIYLVIMNRPKSLNAINDETMKELHDFFGTKALQIADLKGIIITGAGEKAFVAGADIKQFLTLDVEKATEKSRFGQEAFFFIERFPKPVIAAVNGFALGAGCELAMACHLRIAGEKARFGQPEVNLGIIPGYAGTQRLIQLIGKGKAMELCMTGDMLRADEAQRLGLVNQVVPVGEEVAKSKEMMAKILTKGPIAIQKIIETVNAYFQYDEDGFQKEVTEFGNLAGTKDFKEGATAFIEKRAADFKGE